jgi:YVTN family beta-propeller protein
VEVGTVPYGVAITPDGEEVYVANYADNNVSVIDTQTNIVALAANVGKWPVGVAITPDGKYTYVANNGDGTASVIDTETESVSTVSVGSGPVE